MRILGIAGSLREESFNRMLLRTAADLAPDGVELAEWDRVAELPPFSEADEADPHPAVTDLRAAIETVGAVLICTSEYNGSIPGQLKNALDWASRPCPDHVLRDKPVAVLDASPSGAARAQAETRAVCERPGARVVPCELPLPTVHEHVEDRRVSDDEHRAAIRTLLGELAAS